MPDLHEIFEEQKDVSHASPQATTTITSSKEQAPLVLYAKPKEAERIILRDAPPHGK